MLERAREQANIELLTPYAVEALRAGRERRLSIAKLVNTETGETARCYRSRVHLSPVGHEPQSSLVDGQIELDGNGYVKVEGRSLGLIDLACLPPATLSITPTARRSQPPALAARRRWTPSGTCATRQRCPRLRGCQLAIWPRPSGRHRPRLRSLTRLPKDRRRPLRARREAADFVAVRPGERRERRERQERREDGAEAALRGCRSAGFVCDAA